MSRRSELKGPFLSSPPVSPPPAVWDSEAKECSGTEQCRLTRPFFTLSISPHPHGLTVSPTHPQAYSPAAPLSCFATGSLSHCVCVLALPSRASVSLCSRPKGPKVLLQYPSILGSDFGPLASERPVGAPQRPGLAVSGPKQSDPTEGMLKVCMGESSLLCSTGNGIPKGQCRFELLLRCSPKDASCLQSYFQPAKHHDF